MSRSSALINALFFVLTILFMVALAVGMHEKPTAWHYGMGMGLGALTGSILIAVPQVFKRFTLRSFNITAIGLFFGYLMSWTLLLIVDAIIDITGFPEGNFICSATKIFIYLLGAYMGVVLTMRASNELYISIPFVKLAPSPHPLKKILPDLSALLDSRMLELANSGLLDNRLLIPSFLIKDVDKIEEDFSKTTPERVLRTHDSIKRLEAIPHLNLRYFDTDFHDVNDSNEKLIRLAGMLDADILTAEINPCKLPQTESLRYINFNTLSTALKPIMQKGESIKIKIQRPGKEGLQGIGYLEDGTMVVVNGGGAYIGELIRARMLSVKQSASGRMIFCNVIEDQESGNDE